MRRPDPRKVRPRPGRSGEGDRPGFDPQIWALDGTEFRRPLSHPPSILGSLSLRSTDAPPIAKNPRQGQT